MADPLDFPEEQEADEPWFIEPKDKDPRSESQRQRAFLSDLSRLAPAVSAFAVPNAGKRSDWERLERWREGARKGVLDLSSTGRGSRGPGPSVRYSSRSSATC
jgi:hypothetical protein